jgi:hypothetical protein
MSDVASYPLRLPRSIKAAAGQESSAKQRDQHEPIRGYRRR